MRCRRLKKDNDVNNVVWFGSYGITADGHSKFYNKNDIHDNFADKQQGVCDSLTQRLSVIRGELWYNINFGLPLLEKIESKIAIDAAISEIVLAHPDVEEIETFESTKTLHNYSAKMKINTVFGKVNLSI